MEGGGRGAHMGRGWRYSGFDGLLWVHNYNGNVFGNSMSATVALVSSLEKHGSSMASISGFVISYIYHLNIGENNVVK